MFQTLRAGSSVNLSKVRERLAIIERRAFVAELVLKREQNPTAERSLIKARREAVGLRDFLVSKAPSARSEICRLSCLLRPVGER